MTFEESALRPLPPESRWMFFDLDGTLVDTKMLHAESLAIAFTTCVNMEFDVDTLEATRGYPFDDQLHRLLGETWLTRTHDERCALVRRIKETYREYYVAKLPDHVRVFDGIPEVLRILLERSTGLAIVSSKRRGIGQLELNALDIMKFFSVTIFSNDVVAVKPSPEPVFAAMRRANLDPSSALHRSRVAMIGDSTEDLRAAEAARVRSVLASWAAGSPRATNAVINQVICFHPKDLLSLEW